MADQKLSELTELAATPADDDEVYLRDVSEEPAAESKRITVANLAATADAKITTHKNDASAHHTKYSDAEAKAAAVQSGAITDGVTKAPTHDAVYDVKVTADTATTPAEVDSKILTHKNIAAAHHARYADAEADARIALHAAIAAAHHAKYTDAEAKPAAVQSGAITDGVTKAPTHDAVFDVKATADAAQTAAEVDADIATHAALSVAGTHGSTTAATANKIVHRDAAGRAKVVAPSNETDIALKSNVTTVNSALTTHGNLQTAHGAVSAATGSKMVVRDASARAKFAAPGAAGDALIKGSATITHAEVAAANKDGVAATPGMRTLGTGAQQAAAGNHAHTLAEDIKGSGISAELTTTSGGYYRSIDVLAESETELATTTDTYAAVSMAVAVGFILGGAIGGEVKIRVYMGGVQVAESGYIGSGTSNGGSYVVVGTRALSGSQICKLTAYNYEATNRMLWLGGARSSSSTAGAAIGVGSIKL